MNGRLYDPVTTRFFSPDPYVQMPDFTQSFNRYSYCLNNPLHYTDPSGEFVHLIIGAAISAFTNVVVNGFNGNIRNPGQAFAYFGVGAVSGAAGAGIGAGISSILGNGSFGAGFISSNSVGISTGVLSGAASGAGAGLSTGFILGAGNTWIQGGNFTQGVTSGLIYGTIGGISGAINGAILGGIDAFLKKRNVWTGKDIMMGRNAFSFKNTDLPATHYFRESSSNAGINTNKIDYISDITKKGRLNSITLKPKIENHVWTGKPDATIFVGNMKGRGSLDYSGWIENGFNLQILFDGNPVLSLSSGNYPTITTIPIPSGTQYIHIKLSGSYPYYYQNATGITTFPFKSTIYGIMK